MKIKTLDIHAKEWLDCINGNSYFSCRIIVNYGLKSEKTLYVPFMYGYGDSYRYAAINVLYDNRLLPQNFSLTYFRQYTEVNKIIVRYNKDENRPKKEVLLFGNLN